MGPAAPLSLVPAHPAAWRECSMCQAGCHSQGHMGQPGLPPSPSWLCPTGLSPASCDTGTETGLLAACRVPCCPCAAPVLSLCCPCAPGWQHPLFQTPSTPHQPAAPLQTVPQLTAACKSHRRHQTSPAPSGVSPYLPQPPAVPPKIHLTLVSHSAASKASEAQQGPSATPLLLGSRTAEGSETKRHQECLSCTGDHLSLLGRSQQEQQEQTGAPGGLAGVNWTEFRGPLRKDT